MRSETGWIAGRKPRLDELRLLSQRGGRRFYGGAFLVWDGESIDIDHFELPLGGKAVGQGAEEGYWHHAGVRAWMPLPEPPAT